MVRISPGFVSNSSGTSYVVMIPRGFTVTDEEIREANNHVEGYYTRDRLLPKITKPILEEVKREIRELVNGGSCSAEDAEFLEDEENEIEASTIIKLTSMLIPDQYKLVEFETGQDSRSCLISVDREQILEIQEEERRQPRITDYFRPEPQPTQIPMTTTTGQP
ncbi:hypothetical protein Pelo_389 [Pelomyxa schiedti]|nr:hypothetical protein Pelo_389 [Pelomyxa schiedti]